MSAAAGSAPLDRSAALDLQRQRRAQPARSRREACRSASPARAASTPIRPRQSARRAYRATSVPWPACRCRPWRAPKAPVVLATTRNLGRLRARRALPEPLRTCPVRCDAGTAPKVGTVPRALLPPPTVLRARSRREACRSASPARAACIPIRPQLGACRACRAASVQRSRRHGRRWSPARAPRAHSLLAVSRSAPFARQGPLQKLWPRKTSAWNAYLGASAQRVQAHRGIARSVRSAISSAVRNGKTARIAQWERSAARRAASAARNVQRG